ncbi:phage holin family protein [Bradyrhizobium sp. CCGUVB23]|uniref:phage holin family protein n=1 Tax=Bradyrhizobium sp. CCGUVB23 TaxID=2949630 RepID=UPI0020B2BF2C|nr:phage holin family protein [Bradyrhizobium sp. CCGUVB23]MCP3463402.1 phage holin family protein [Bradyrhizobium sp. CCGUVB23]
MSTENIVSHLRVLWRTDRIIADIRLRHLLIGLSLRAFAALIATFGLLMLELSAYFALVQIWSAIVAAAVLGAINFAIAAVLFIAAGRPPSGREIELANEIHGAAIEALQLEARALHAQVTGAAHHPLSGLLPIVTPLVAIVAKSLRKSPVAPSSPTPHAGPIAGTTRPE